ncbi:hypothetical protein GV794_09020 [Nocardia cyriacigeorgica]|uniref:Uncharacterized protein n=1 Tax=Nocardia cyriacigeorgica TaxID=135487 RepID=A0A6P1DBN5_9NOCA|nr:hypothetical protein [Nocardia cyriacigeorgica]NEW41487.1 hypothetical protein [Nocardia cyriacigeorgica]NEW45742.1 hypothetical protein [Nocardia cyriacigeorgica]NEW51999.1 hypothetical protein [Nocardia cyriacigeorgica]NEW55792.1 hypothetical protein [Nocardia cyriacigeorgica]
MRSGTHLAADDPAAYGEAQVPAERPDLTAWRKRHALRSSNAAQPLPNKRRYRRERRHATADYR